MSEHFKAGYQKLTPTRRGERRGRYSRNLLTPVGKIERLEVLRDREGQFVTEPLSDTRGGRATWKWQS
jgi:putative transposase